MFIMFRKSLSITLILCAAIISLSACGKIRGVLNDTSSLDYQNNQAIKKLEVPPDLTQPEFDKSFELPTGIISAVSLKNGTAMPQSGVSNSTQSSSNIGAVRSGELSSIRTIAGKTVLKVNDTYPRSKILTEIMLTKLGFTTVTKSSSGDVITAKYNGEDVSTSVSEGTGFFSNFKNFVTFGSERRKLNSSQALVNGKSYRITISNEQGSPIVRFARTDGTNIADAAHAKIITLLNTTFNSAVSLQNGTTNASQPSNQATSSSSSTSTSNTGDVRRGELSSIKSISGKTVLQVNDTYPRSLVLTEIMLTRMGFTTANKSSAGDVITATYTGKDIATSESKGTGFFSNFKNFVTFGRERRKLNSSQALVNGKSYRITISNEQGSPIVRFARTDGTNIADAAHAKIISLLNTTFNS